MGDHRRHMSVAEAAAALEIGKTTLRRIFDAAKGAAGERDPDTGERQVDRAWVAAKIAARRARPVRTVPATLSVAEAAERLQVSRNTVLRWFDRDQPASGQLVDGGRTGGTERRCSVAWVQRLESRRAPGSSPSG